MSVNGVCVCVCVNEVCVSVCVCARVRETERVNEYVSYRHPNEVHFIGHACYLAQKVTKVEKQNKLEERILRGNNYQNKYKVPLNFFLQFSLILLGPK